MKEIRKVFCLKYLNMFSVPLQFLAVCVGYYFIEAISRHSLFSAMDFMTERPLVFLYNAFLIFTTTLIVYLFRRRVFWRTILFIFWMGLGIINGILLSTRVTPFTGPDLHLITDAFEIADRYLSPFFFVVVVILFVLAILGLIWLFIKGPKYQGKMSYKWNVPLILAGVLAFAGTTKLALDKRVLSNYFGNIAFAYEDYGYPYCLATTVFNTGIGMPRGYNEKTIDEIEKSTETLPETGEKRGCNGLFNRMNFAIEDPVLTYTVSPYQTACGAVDIAMHTIERYFCPGEDTYLTDSIAEAVIKSVRKAAGDCLKNPEDYTARANMMWASSLAHNGLTQCGREFQLVVHQLEHEVSGMYPEVAHGAGLAALWCSWARYVYKANINRWLQYASNVWGLDIDFEHPEKTIETAIDMQEQYYASIGMPIGLKELGVKEDDLAKLALDCSRNKTRSLIGYKPLAYEDILVIYQMAYERG